jgi:hypothetical protein
VRSGPVTARDQVLAELATPGPAPGHALSLLAQARELARFADQVHGELARLIGLIDATGAYAEAGYGSTAAFARHACGRAHARAGELVATGRALRQLEATRTALAAGRVSFDAAHVICRAVTQIGDQTLAAAAEQQMLAAASTGLSRSRTAAEAVGARAGGAPSEADTGRGLGSDTDTDIGSDADMDGGLGGGGARDADGGSGADPQTGEPGASGSDAHGPYTADQGSWVLPGLDPRELRRLGEDLTYRADPDAVEERQRKRFERRYLSFGITLDNVGTISGACGDALSMEIIRTAAEAFSPPGGSHDRRTAAQRRMDGLTAACQAALDSGTARTRHGARPHLTILLDAEGGTDPSDTQPGEAEPGGTQRERPGDTPGPVPGPGRTAHGAMLTARQILTLACRAEISLIRWRDGLPLDVGRRYRTDTPALRRALTARDQGCRFPGCGIPATWCTAHHIHRWKHGGRTRLPNLVLLCFVHHQYFVHQEGWTLTGAADGTLQFTHPRTGLSLASPLPGQTASRSP